MKISILTFTLLFFGALQLGYSSPRITYQELFYKIEQDPRIQIDAEAKAYQLNIPLRIFTIDKVFIFAATIEDQKVVYAVITDILHPDRFGYAAFWDEILAVIDFNKARIDYGGGNIIDNTGGMFDLKPTKKTTIQNLLLIPEWTYDKVMAFDAMTGDLIDTAYIHSINPILQSPKHAIQSPWGNIFVSDQISDAVQEFDDTTRAFIRTFAPAGGPNPNILDNIRGIGLRPNKNLLVTVGSSANQNTVQEFDTAGTNLGTFMSTNLNSPFAILKRQDNYLVSNSSGTNDVIKFNLDGSFASVFIASTNLTFAQQMIRLQNGNIAIAGFSSPSGIIFFDSSGNYLNSFTAVTGNRGIYRLGNGNFLTTNGTGVYEIDDTTGSLVRTIVTGVNVQYIDLFIPPVITESNNNTNEVIETFKLFNNYPNPFNPTTTIKYNIPKPGIVTLRIFDITGKLINTLVNDYQQRGQYTIVFDASKLSSGVYFYQLSSGQFTQTKKMLYLK